MRKLVVALAAVTMAVSGCSSFTGIYDIPLPGGADVGDHPFTVKARFKDVLDLVPQSGVKVNEVPVGRVEDIQLAPDGWTAEVTMLINGDVDLPANALAMLRQSSLLGEKYVELSPPPPDRASGKLADERADPHRADQPQHRHRRGARRAVDAAQRRRHRAAAEHRAGAEQRADGQRVRHPQDPRQRRHPGVHFGREQVGHHPRHRRGEPARRHAEQRARPARRRDRQPRPGPEGAHRPARPAGAHAAEPAVAVRRRGPHGRREPGGPGGRPQGADPGAVASWARRARTCRSRCRSCSRSRSPTRP